MSVGSQTGIWAESGETKTAEEAARAGGQRGVTRIEVFDSEIPSCRSDPRPFRDVLQASGVTLSGTHWDPPR
jgi:hypothetical protein